MNFVVQALQMLKEHPSYKDDDEIQGTKCKDQNVAFWIVKHTIQKPEQLKSPCAAYKAKPK